MLLSKYLTDNLSSSPSFSGRILYANWTNLTPNGRSSIVVMTLNTVCTFAIWAGIFPGVNDCINWANGKIKLIVTKIIVPIILNDKWIIVVLLAFLPVPILAKTAVIQVPIFCPNNTYIADGNVITPLLARACKIPTDAEELCIIAVNTAPTKIPIKGFSKVLTILTNSGELLSGDIAVDIISIPINKIPSPAIIVPNASNFLLLKKTIKATPANAITGANAVISIAINWPVIVVPILAPIITQTAFSNLINPALTKPTVITVVADDDWITAVIIAPTPTPKKRLVVSFSKILFILFPAANSKPFDIIVIPYKNNAKPPNIVNKSVSFIFVPLLNGLFYVQGKFNIKFVVCKYN